MGESLALIVLISVFAIFVIFFAIDRLILRDRFIQNVTSHLTEITDTLIACDFPFSAIEDCQIAVLNRFTKKSSVSEALMLMSKVSAINLRVNVVAHSKKIVHTTNATDEKFLCLLEEWPELENVKFIQNLKGVEEKQSSTEYLPTEYLPIESVPAEVVPAETLEDQQPKCICGLCYPSPPGTFCSPAVKEKIKKVLSIVDQQNISISVVNKQNVSKKAPKQKKTEDFDPIHSPSKDLDLS